MKTLHHYYYENKGKPYVEFKKKSISILAMKIEQLQFQETEFVRFKVKTIS